MQRVGLRRRRGVRIALWGGGVLVLLLVASQFLLPPIAERVARSRAERYGRVESVHISAFPALALLWGHAQSATVRLGDVDATPAEAVDLLWNTRGIDRVDVTAQSTKIGLLQMHQVTMHKRGRSITQQATVSEADIRAGLPAGAFLQSVAAHDGQLEVRVGGELFGVSLSLRALLVAQEGRLVLEPQDLGPAGLIHPTLFSDPRLSVEAVTFTPLSGSGGGTGAEGASSWRLNLRASLRDG